MTREDAFLIFDKLRAEDASIFCTGRLLGWTVSFRGRIVSASREEVILVSTDRHSGSMSLRLDAEDLLIRYAEPREIPMVQGAEGRDLTLASIIVALPLRLRPGDLRKRLLDAPPRELLFFLELPANET
ncbi:MAG TPA: hypothetical protein VFY29_09035 [Terriglobia bacterium]|nr:hypothetical protein [Terriglobia bacterium]